MSITLTTALTITGGGINETDAAAAAMSFTVDHTQQHPQLIVTFQNGNVSGANLAVGAVAGQSTITVTVDLVTGVWSASNGVKGTLTGPQLTSLLNSIKTLRNTFETFAVSNAIIAGVQVPW